MYRSKCRCFDAKAWAHNPPPPASPHALRTTRRWVGAGSLLGGSTGGILEDQKLSGEWHVPSFGVWFSKKSSYNGIIFIIDVKKLRESGRELSKVQIKLVARNRALWRVLQSNPALQVAR